MCIYINFFSKRFIYKIMKHMCMHKYKIYMEWKEIQNIKYSKYLLIIEYEKLPCNKIYLTILSEKRLLHSCIYLQQIQKKSWKRKIMKYTCMQIIYNNIYGMKRDCFIMYSKRLIHIIYHKEKKCSFYYSKYLLIMKNCLMNDNIYIKFPWPHIKWRKKLLHLSTTNPIWKRICMHKYKIHTEWKEIAL